MPPAEAGSVHRYYQLKPVSDTTLALMWRMGITAIYRMPRTSRRILPIGFIPIS